jgi:hypothetical protein
MKRQLNAIETLLERKPAAGAIAPPIKFQTLIACWKSTGNAANIRENKANANIHSVLFGI